MYLIFQILLYIALWIFEFWHWLSIYYRHRWCRWRYTWGMVKTYVKNGDCCDQVFFGLAAECINRRIILHSVIKEDMTGLNIIVPKAELDPELPTIHMLYFKIWWHWPFSGTEIFSLLLFCSGSLSKVVNQEKLHI